MREPFIRGAIFLLSLGALSFFNQLIHQSVIPLRTQPLYVPISFYCEFKELISDMHWFQLLAQDYDVESLYVSINHILALDPSHNVACRFSAVVLLQQYGVADQAISILKKGRSFTGNQSDWRIPFYIAWAYQYHLKESVKAKESLTCALSTKYEKIPFLLRSMPEQPDLIQTWYDRLEKKESSKDRFE